MVIAGPAIVVSVVMTLDLMRRVMILDGTPVFLLNEAVVISVEVAFPPIDVPHVDFIDMRGCGVIEELVPAPFAALKSSSGIAVSIADSPVIAHVRSPIPGVKAVVAAVRSPIGWSPEHAGCRRSHPGSRGPVVAAWAVCPVTGRP
jgi:hypothetical protein